MTLVFFFEVGKAEFLQELRKFNVRNEKGFELSQLGKLTELGGSLEICDLENVQTKEEADGAKLIHKSRLHELILEWDINPSNINPTQERDVLESLRPHSNLRDLCIRGHGGINCPTWLDANLSVKNLESLKLSNVSWKDLPPLGELFLVDESGEERLSCAQSQIFHNLEKVELAKIERLRKWVVSCPHSVSYQNLKRLELTKTSYIESGCVGNGACYLFAHLEVLIIQDCPELFEPLQWEGADKATTCFPKLTNLGMSYCWEVTGLGVMGQNAVATPPPLEEKMDLALAENEQQQGRAREVQIPMSVEGLVRLPPQLQELEINSCPGLRPQCNSLLAADYTVGEAGGGLRGLRSLRSFSFFV
ncbi:hypothetical protein BAE44_0019038 [Dichanthelium oligosanthes]|uniref:R13L1/DRL21-like LRR repeat region domain-containing protein n=1 Tax=Dichanthelium oligosanthes TaxID=888268 RepID=A0A1E5V4H6_9POAL|nr:hypothetical protein BAE44_0019038 [Dichanthelium oligosanthes]